MYQDKSRFTTATTTTGRFSIHIRSLGPSYTSDFSSSLSIWPSALLFLVSLGPELANLHRNTFQHTCIMYAIRCRTMSGAWFYGYIADDCTCVVQLADCISVMTLGLDLAAVPKPVLLLRIALSCRPEEKRRRKTSSSLSM